MDPQIDRVTRHWYEEGCKFARAGRLSEAVTAFTKAIDHSTGFAEAFFRRGVCYYLLNNRRLATQDLEAAALLGCRDAQMWSRYDIQRFDNSEEP
jgi:Flp pilus assembly protein TadD